MVRAIRRMKLKVVVVGDRTVGKTSLVNRYVFDTFSDVYHGTLGSRLNILSFSQVVSGDELIEADIALFDLMGERSAREAFKDVMFWGTNGFLVVADVTRRETISSIPGWIETVESVAGEIPHHILLNKADLAGGSISPEDTEWLIAQLPGVPYHLTSAKTAEGVERAFESLVRSMVDKSLEKSRLRRKTLVVGGRILEFASRRGRIGVTNKELLTGFKQLDVPSLMKEVDSLVKLGLVTREESGPASFRIVITEKGAQEIERKGLSEKDTDDTAA
jgi:small GTP-binding protein